MIQRQEYPSSGTQTGTITLASGLPYSAHADFLNSWHQGRLQQLTGDCPNQNLDCGTPGSSGPRPPQPPPPPPQPQPPPPAPPPPPPPRPAAPRTPAQAYCVVPNVKSKRLAGARSALRRARCALGRVARTYSPKVRPGRIVSQSRRPGARLRRGTRVNVVVSRGKLRRR